MNFCFGRAAGRKTASTLFLAALLTTLLTACGVKNDLIRPNGQATSKSERDPSLPPSTTGR
jgi:hypothetical protein